MDTFNFIQESLDTSLESGLLYSEASLSKLKTSELKEALKALDLPIYGTKATLIQRLLDNQEEEILEVESILIIKKETEEENNGEPKRESGYVEPARGTKV